MHWIDAIQKDPLGRATMTKINKNLKKVFEICYSGRCVVSVYKDDVLISYREARGEEYLGYNDWEPLKDKNGTNN